MANRDFYPKLEQVQKIEKILQTQKHGGKYSKDDIYVAGPSGTSHDDEEDARAESIKPNLKILPAPTFFFPSFSESSDEEEPMLTDTCPEEGIPRNVNANLLYPIDLKEIRQEYSFPSISDLVLKKEPGKAMADGSEPMSVANDSLSEEPDSNVSRFLKLENTFVDPALMKPDQSQGDVQKNESQLFEDMNLEFETKILKKELDTVIPGNFKSKKNKNKPTPYNKSEKPNELEEQTNVPELKEKQIIAKELVGGKQKIKEELEDPQENELKEQQKRDLEARKLREQSEAQKLREESKAQKLREELKAQKLREELKAQKLREELKAQKLREESEEQKKRKNADEKRGKEATVFDETMLAANMEVSTEEIDVSDTSSMDISSINSEKRKLNNIDDKADINENKRTNVPLKVNLKMPQDISSIKKTQIIKMEHFYYTKEDGYKRYRDMIGLEIRRRSYTEKFKNRKTLMVEGVNKTPKLVNAYDIPPKAAEQNGSIQKLQGILLKCMLEPVGALSNKATNDSS